ncbi:MAG: 3-phosphoshikimate 1-carboxyvinyltransferase [Anaerolineaceae bacterium]|nr:3-phosphoshikimate 1-carboxyvinyltransferase [Anaerolineaceae bacterium]
MSRITVFPSKKITGEISVDGDKSITHRAIMHAGLATGTSSVTHFLNGNDCQATINCMRGMGVEIVEENEQLTITGHGLNGLKQPSKSLDCGRSGTTMRLLMGLLCGMDQKKFVLDGDTQLQKRPMERVAKPLRKFGATINTSNGTAPVEIIGTQLHGKEIKLDVPSAQVKSALIYAGLYAQGNTVITQFAPTRDHTERMLSAQGVSIVRDVYSVKVTPTQKLAPIEMVIPGDISSAAFPIAAAVISPQAELTIRDVGLNDSRTGLIDILVRMGAKIKIDVIDKQAIEPIGNLFIQDSALNAIELGGDMIVRAIDEIPLVALLATQANGKTVIRDAAELRVKETDRIQSISEELNKLGAQIEATPDGMIIQGPTPLKGTLVDSHGDHRIAMALFIAGCIADGQTTINHFECVTDSFPGFTDIMASIGALYE